MENSISEILTFTGDTPEDNIDGSFPILYFCTWTEYSNGLKRNIVKHKFYDKPVSRTMVIMNTFFQSHRLKMVTLSQEVNRRMRNTDQDVNIETRAYILKKFKVNMIKSGYKSGTVINIMNSGLEGYYIMVENEGK